MNALSRIFRHSFVMFLSAALLLPGWLVAEGIPEPAGGPFDFDMLAGGRYRGVEAIAYRGAIELSPDADSIRSMPGRSYLYMSGRYGLQSYALIAEPGPGGEPEIQLEVNGTGRLVWAWYRPLIGRALEDASYMYGLGMAPRMQGLYRQDGIDTALEVLRDIETDIGRHFVTRRFVRDQDLSAPEYLRLIRAVGEVLRRSELAGLLIDLSQFGPDSDLVTGALMAEAARILSGEHRTRVLVSVAQNRGLESGSAVAMAKTLRTGASAPDQAAALAVLADLAPWDEKVVSAYLAATQMVLSSEGKREALLAFSESYGVFDAKLYHRILGVTQSIVSSSDKTEVLLHLFETQGLPDSVFPAYLRVTVSIISASDKSNVLIRLIDGIAGTESASEPRTAELVANTIKTVLFSSHKIVCLDHFLHMAPPTPGLLDAYLGVVETIVIADDKEHALLELLKVEGLSRSFVLELRDFVDKRMPLVETRERVQRAIDERLASL